MINQQQDHRTPRILRGVALSAIASAALIALMGIILWDADLYTARDRYEHLKVALFGDWSPNWCPPGRETVQCAKIADFETVLEDATDFTFFRTEKIAGSNLTVQTGTRFATARDVVNGTASSQWCYIAVAQGQVSQHIELAKQSAGEPPIYTRVAALDASAVAVTSLSAEALTGLSRTHCHFD